MYVNITYNGYVDKPSQVSISKFAEKQLRRLPTHLREHVRFWAASVEELGIHEVRKLAGYHDEPLRGDRKGQRSIRLNRAYRLIYEESSNANFIVIGVIEVNKHEC